MSSDDPRMTRKSFEGNFHLSSKLVLGLLWLMGIICGRTKYVEPVKGCIYFRKSTLSPWPMGWEEVTTEADIIVLLQTVRLGTVRSRSEIESIVDVYAFGHITIFIQWKQLRYRTFSEMQFSLSGVYRNVNTPEIAALVCAWNNIEKLP